ncbi:HNH endonuclease signature motif containing protein [Ornithinimicrobium humiphilum]|uniref:HNH endonuclease n=1 Tax=Ornithinimicrobium humiphilum TaxID=125288 RepID=A0A543KNN0_9MICO|nr:HNH endonuclease signature motif containing protein [Ornithinimicrobium humiphilum]TQM96673.1 HNH endonuclease [Ornithinimicrobium humiphilum]
MQQPLGTVRPPRGTESAAGDSWLRADRAWLPRDLPVDVSRPELVQDDLVVESLGWISRAVSDLERSRLVMATEAVDRGLHLAEGFTVVDWLALKCPDLERRALMDLARLAQAGREPVHAPLIERVKDGQLSIARAARLHRALQRVRPGMPPEEYAAAVELLAKAGSDPVFDEKDISRMVDRLVASCVDERDHEAKARKKHAMRGIHESSLADGSVKRWIITFGDDADYEAAKAIIDSPLAAPASKEEQDATGELDLRTATQRRYDAFVTVLRRGVAGTQGQPTTPKATLMVTLDFETLKRQLSETGGHLPGVGATLAGVPLRAEAIRRLACEADIIPVVLGGPSEILDQGRRKRLVTPAQRVRLAARDRGCTIPGCTVPATWCDAHHVVPWARGGRSDLSNYALLCPRHHTFVHDRGLTATVTELGVRWHLR